MFSSRLGTFGVVADSDTSIAQVISIFLPAGKGSLEDVIRNEFPGGICKSHRLINQVGTRIQRYLEGDKLLFTTNDLDLAGCPDFQKRVLAVNFKVPRGRVTTYGAIAKKLGSPQGARAVGTALAANPFPIIIPCHRVVRADGNPGGFGGGPEMKRALLEMEGVGFSRNGLVLPEFIV